MKRKIPRTKRYIRKLASKRKNKRKLKHRSHARSRKIISKRTKFKRGGKPIGRSNNSTFGPTSSGATGMELVLTSPEPEIGDWRVWPVAEGVKPVQKWQEEEDIPDYLKDIFRQMPNWNIVRPGNAEGIKFRSRIQSHAPGIPVDHKLLDQLRERDNVERTLMELMTD